MNIDALIEAVQDGSYADAMLTELEGAPIAYTITKGGRPVLVDLSEFAPAPTEKRGRYTFTAPADFAAYVQRHATPGTEMFVQPREGTATAILDGHAEHAAGHGRHVADLRLAKSAAWERITGPAGATLNQEAFANWLDDIREEVRGLDTDELVELVDNLHVFSTANQKEVRATSHGRTIAFQEDVTIKAGKAGVDLPNKLLVESTVFEGVEKAWRFEVRLSVVASPGNPTKFRLAVPRMNDLLEAATKEALDVVRALTNVPAYAGTARHGGIVTPTVIN